MTAAVTVGHGGPEKVEVHRDWPVPKPGAGEALIRVTAAGVNNTDLWTRQGAYGSAGDPEAVAGWKGVPLDFPRIQGGDVTGIVEALGDGVSERFLGKRILIDPASEYDDDGHPTEIAGSERDGGFAEFHVWPGHRLHDVSASPLTDEQLACLPIAYATALGMIVAADCQPGERVLVTGASGGVGLAAVQILAVRGCHAIAYTSPGKEEALAASGAAEILTRGQGRLSDTAEVDVVLDVVGGDGFGDVVDRLRSGGRLAIAGAIAGPVIRLDLRRVYLRHRQIIGSTMHTPQVFAGVVELARRGAVAPIVADTYPLAEIAKAQERFSRKDFVGKLVLVPRASRA